MSVTDENLPKVFLQSKSFHSKKLITSSIPRRRISSARHCPLTLKTLPPYLSRNKKIPMKSNSSVTDYYDAPSERRFQLMNRNYQLNPEGYKVLDLSSQGLTTLYTSLFSDDKIGVINLHDNNIRSIQPAISRLRNLTRLDLSKNDIICRHLADFSGLPTDMEKLVNLVDLRLSECNFAYIPAVVWHLKNLIHLDLSRNRLNKIPSELGNLTSLRTLNLKRTNITTLPPEIAYCQQLEILLLWGNQMEQLPETISDIPNLKVLAINYRNFSRMIDSYQETLLCKAQIISEHIPPAVFEMKAIETLNLEGTKINAIPAQLSTVNLKELCLRQNYLQKLPKSFFQLTQLKILDLSKNFFCVLPEKIGMLKSLQTFHCSGNLLEKIPVSLFTLENLEDLDFSKNSIIHIPKEIGNLQKLTRLILRNNKIQNLPEQISKLTQLKILDVGENFIRKLPLQMAKMINLTEAHVYHKIYKHGLWIDKNPLQQPPSNIWKTTSTQTIFEHLKRFEITNLEHIQQLKVIFLGESQSGKTSLKNLLLNGWSDLLTGSQESTKILEISPAKTTNGVKLIFYDIGCDEIYSILWHLFLDSKSLTIIVYNHSTYTSSDFFGFIGRWLKLAWFYMPETIIRIVGTHSEIMTAEQVVNTLSIVQKDVRNYINLHRLNVEKETAITAQLISTTKQSDKTTNIKQLYLRKEKLNYISLVSKMNPAINVVSCNVCKDGIDELVKEMEMAVVDSSLFPHIHQPVDPKWHRFCKSLKKCTNQFLLSWEEIIKLCEPFPFLHHNDSLHECLQFLHNTGEILWYSHISNFVFHRPQMFADLLADLFRKDMPNWLTETNKILACRGNMSGNDIAVTRKMLQNEGQITRSLLKSIWFHRKNIKRDTFKQLVDVLPLLNICYNTTAPDLLNLNYVLRNILVIPWFCTNKVNLDNCVEWPSSVSKDIIQKQLLLKFPFQIPIGLFEILNAKLNTCFQFQKCWSDGAYGKTDSVKVLIQKTDTSQDAATKILILCRGFCSASVSELLHLINKTVCSTLAHIPGLYYIAELKDV